MSDATQAFGGDWTEEKLIRLRKYLPFYTEALKIQPTEYRPYELVYIDAFAGSGYRTPPSRNTTSALQHEFDSLGEAVETVKSGSARIALEIERPFGRYFFIEKNPKWVSSLEKLRDEFPDRTDRVEIIRNDANAALQELCTGQNWENRRGVLFLDPYGAQVEWDTIKTIASRVNIDIWYLFPYCAVNRMTPEHGQVDSKWAERLDRLFGDQGWRDEFFVENPQGNLFAEPGKMKSTSPEKVERYIISRLKTICPPTGVAPYGLQLVGRGQVMYILLFACTNPSKAAQALARKYADQLLK